MKCRLHSRKSAKHWAGAITRPLFTVSRKSREKSSRTTICAARCWQFASGCTTETESGNRGHNPNRISVPRGWLAQDAEKEGDQRNALFFCQLDTQWNLGWERILWISG